MLTNKLGLVAYAILQLQFAIAGASAKLCYGYDCAKGCLCCALCVCVLTAVWHRIYHTSGNVII